MKFTFFANSNKKKTQIIKAKTKEDFLSIASIAKCEIIKNSILTDIDFKDSKLMCKVGGNVITMKELLALISKKLKKFNVTTTNDNISDLNSDKNKKKKKSKKKLKVDKKSKKKKSKKKKSKSQDISNSTPSINIGDDDIIKESINRIRIHKLG